MEVRDDQQRAPTAPRAGAGSRPPPTGSGPASTTTASPGPTGSTTASPWPTSQATSTAPAGGQPGREPPHRGGTRPRPPSAATRTTRRQAGQRGHQDQADRDHGQGDRATDPGRPGHRPGRHTGTGVGHRDEPAGRPGGEPGQQRGQRQATVERRRPPPRRAGWPARSRARPAGSPARPPGSPHPRGQRPPVRRRPGRRPRRRAPRPAPDGTPRSRRRSRHRGASRTRPPVASTDRANPASTASAGSITQPGDRRDRERRRGRPWSARVARASRPTAPMAAARTTLGDGRARITKPARASQADHRGEHTGRRGTNGRRSSTTPSTMATFAPLTATRWVMPVARKSSSTPASRRLVSPMTSPGSRPPGSAGSGAQAACSPARSRPAADCVHDGAPSSRGSPARRQHGRGQVAAPGRGEAGRPRATRWLGSSVRHAGSVAKTTTRACSPISVPSGVRSRVRSAADQVRGRADAGWSGPAAGRR